MNITGVLLAAGKSTRFGSNKLLHPLADGCPVALASARVLSTACCQLVAIVNQHNTELKALLSQEGYRVMTCTHSQAGIGSSIAQAVTASAESGGWLIALADMPYIQPYTLSVVVRRMDATAIVVPRYQGRRGHPVGFGRHWFDDLTALSGDQGARSIIEQNSAYVVCVDGDDKGVLIDIDVPEDVR